MRLMKTRFLGVAPAMLVLLALAGCAADQPVVTYEPYLEMADLAPGLEAPDNDYRLLTDEQTLGRFACPIAVAKYVLKDDLNGHHLTLENMHSAEQAYWSERMRGFSDVTELVFLTETSIRPFGGGTQNACRTAVALGAPLLLIYAPNGLGPNSAQVLGVLYDAHTCRPLAVLHASSRIVNEEGEETSIGDLKGDQRDIDARYQAQRAFEEHLLACVRDLQERDTPPTTTQPHKWHKPLIERWWLPRP